MHTMDTLKETFKNAINALKGDPDNILNILKTDHRGVEQLFNAAETEDWEKKFAYFKQIKEELETHAHVEEKVFYPRLEQYSELKDLVADAYEDHRQVKMTLQEMSLLLSDKEEFTDKLNTLKENVENHVDEEEHSLFPKVEDIFEDEELEQMGQRLKAAKQDYKNGRV